MQQQCKIVDIDKVFLNKVFQCIKDFYPNRFPRLNHDQEKYGKAYLIKILDNEEHRQIFMHFLACQMPLYLDQMQSRKQLQVFFVIYAKYFDQMEILLDKCKEYLDSKDLIKDKKKKWHLFTQQPIAVESVQKKPNKNYLKILVPKLIINFYKDSKIDAKQNPKRQFEELVEKEKSNTESLKKRINELTVPRTSKERSENYKQQLQEKLESIIKKQKKA